jgi:predicted metalloendopeptidase
MTKSKLFPLLAALGALAQGCANKAAEFCAVPTSENSAPIPAPRFSTNYMDTSVSPATNFYLYASGAWMTNNPIPADKSSWSAFAELRERNLQLLHDILYSTIADCDAKPPAPKSPLGEVAAFYASAIDTKRLEELGFTPLREDFAAIDAIKTPEQMLRLLAKFQDMNVPAMFDAGVSPDAKNSAYYAFELSQGGLGLPDRDYYLTEGFADKRAAYQLHVAKMLAMSGESQADATTAAAKILDLETALAKACKARADLRDPIANYNKFLVSDAEAKYPNLPLKTFLDASGLGSLREIIIRQPDFFAALDGLVKDRPLDDWKSYLRWHVLHSAAPYLHDAAENENFAFFGTVLSGAPQQEPRWQRAARVIDSHIGEALGQLYVEKNFPPEARARMNDLVENIKTVFHDHLEKVPWMTPETRAKALVKFNRFTQKIGYPAKFRDYSSIDLRPDDYLGNVRRSAIFESKRQLARVGKAVDKSEWSMTPQTVNAYFNPEFNEIVFPAGILQPPFFDVTMDDAVNYGAIAVVIGHEITHGYDDQGRKYDGDGNLNNWWTTNDAAAFEARAKMVIDQYNGYEALPGTHVRESQLRLSIVTDPHSPGQFRAIGPESNLQQFFDAFGITAGEPMWRSPAERAVIW